MSFVDLKKRFFIKNNVRFNNKVFYKKSDHDTWSFDNSFNTKNIIVPIDESFINVNDFSDPEKLITIRQFFRRLSDEFIEGLTLANQRDDALGLDNSTFGKLRSARNNKSKYFYVLKNLDEYQDVTNSDISLFKYKNVFNIEKIKSLFIIDDPYVYKKNSIKNNLYKSYLLKTRQEYSNLNFGFCNYNTINMFSHYNEENNNIFKHSNFICYANPIIDEDKNKLYDFYNEDFTISSKIILRDINLLSYPNCFLHIPGILNMYFVLTKNNNVRIAVTTSSNTYKNILEIDELTNSILPAHNNNNKIDETNAYISSSDNSKNLKENEWYNLCLRYNSIAKQFTLFVDDSIYDTTNNLSIDLSEDTVNKNSYIMLGNKINYPEVFDVALGFDIMFNSQGKNLNKNSLYNKDILTKDFINTNSISEIYGGDNPILNPQEASIFYNTHVKTESFNGEFSDFRIYKKHILNSDIYAFKDSYVNNLNNEILVNYLNFYLPVFYIPMLTRENQIINCNTNTHVSYYCYYNAPFNAMCGGLDINSGNYLIDFVKASKPNVTIGGLAASNSIYNHFDWQKRQIDEHVIPVLNQDEINNLDETVLSNLRTGKKVFDIYTENILRDNANFLKPNFIYKNLLILPNDNGIPKVNFNIIEEFLTLNTEINDNHVNKNLYVNSINMIDYSHLTCENVVDGNSHIDNVVDYKNLQHYISDREVIPNLSTLQLEENSELKFFDNNELFIKEEGYFKFFSNFNFYNESNTILPILNIGSLANDNAIKIISDKIKSLYRHTDSNPVLRNFIPSNTDMNQKEVFNEIIYNKTPIPYNDMNKDYDSSFVSIFSIPKSLYNKKIEKSSLVVLDENFVNSRRSFSLKDNGYGSVYRSDCKTKVAEWNYQGHIFYNDGILVLNNPVLSYFGYKDFSMSFLGNTEINVNEINIPLDRGTLNLTQNETYDKDLRIDHAAYNSEESFVYITDINLHDENLNIVAKAKLARPIPKKDSDRFLIRLKMDY